MRNKVFSKYDSFSLWPSTGKSHWLKTTVLFSNHASWYLPKEVENLLMPICKPAHRCL